MHRVSLKAIINFLWILLLCCSFLKFGSCSPDTETLYPNGVGTYTEFPNQFPNSGFHWQKVDETVPDEATTYIYSAIDDTGTYIDTFSVQDTSIPEGSTINSVTVSIRERSIPTTGNLKGYTGTEIISHSILYEGTFALGSSTWSYKTTVYNVNPFSSEQWTLEEINAIEIGAKGRSRYDSKNGEWTTADITQCKVIIAYTLAPTGEWHTIESWSLSLSTREWLSVGSWSQYLISRDWNPIEVWSQTLMTKEWNFIAFWTQNLITKQWNILELWTQTLSVRDWIKIDLFNVILSVGISREELATVLILFGIVMFLAILMLQKKGVKFPF